jgi:hemolysin activation/secretion protein
MTALLVGAGVARAQVAAARSDIGGVPQANERNQQVIQQQTEFQYNGPLVVGPKAPEILIPPSGGASFLLRKVTFDHSAFISPEQLDALAAPFVGRRIDNAQLQQLLKSVNDIYAERNIITAIAFLPKQDLKDGILHIGLIEGRLGAMRVAGNSAFPTENVTRAVSERPGEVIDVPQLEREIGWFNRGHLAQVQASLQPGASFGLTDVQLSVIEPHANVLQIFTDNMGVESVGKYEGGLNFQHYGLLGLDDKLTIYGVGSGGNQSANLGYNLSFNPWGGRLGFSWSAGTIQVYQGAYALLDETGRSESGAINVSQPVFVNQNWALLVNGAVCASDFRSDQSQVMVTNDVTKKATAGVTLSYANNSFQISISPNYSFAHTDFDVVKSQQSFQELNDVVTASLRLPYNFVLAFSSASQWASQKLLAGDQLFQIGGPTTVRGYPTNAVAGYAGYYENLELHYGLGQYVKGLDVYAFYDNGMVFSTYPKSVTMNSVGAGLSWDTQKYLLADLSFGVPLTKAVYNQSDLYIYYRLTLKFD